VRDDSPGDVVGTDSARRKLGQNGVGRVAIDLDRGPAERLGGRRAFGIAQGDAAFALFAQGFNGLPGERDNLVGLHP
jgi:hypothetical protein